MTIKLGGTAGMEFFDPCPDSCLGQGSFFIQKRIPSQLYITRLPAEGE